MSCLKRLCEPRVLPRRRRGTGYRVSRLKDLHPVVLPVGDEDVTLGVDGDALQALELGRAGAPLAYEIYIMSSFVSINFGGGQ